MNARLAVAGPKGQKDVVVVIVVVVVVDGGGGGGSGGGGSGGGGVFPHFGPSQKALLAS